MIKHTGLGLANAPPIEIRDEARNAGIEANTDGATKIEATIRGG